MERCDTSSQVRSNAGRTDKHCLRRYFADCCFAVNFQVEVLWILNAQHLDYLGQIRRRPAVTVQRPYRRRSPDPLHGADLGGPQSFFFFSFAKAQMFSEVMRSTLRICQI